MDCDRQLSASQFEAWNVGLGVVLRQSGFGASSLEIGRFYDNDCWADEGMSGIRKDLHSADLRQGIVSKRGEGLAEDADR